MPSLSVRSHHRPGLAIFVALAATILTALLPPAAHAGPATIYTCHAKTGGPNGAISDSGWAGRAPASATFSTPLPRRGGYLRTVAVR
ncbi:MAG TPA: hypothetical protein VK501_12880 [Baekduia sp.]|nr:hypothetical protein [Baekduia sp.]